MARVCITIDVDGEPTLATFTRQPTEEEVEAYREFVRAVRTKFTLTPEQIERQAAARERNAARRKRLGIE